MKAILQSNGSLVLDMPMPNVIALGHFAHAPLMELYRAHTPRDGDREPTLEPGYGGFPWQGGTPVIGETYDIPLDDLHVDPDRLQFRHGHDEDGVTSELDDEAFDPERCPPLAAWKDPDDGLTYVVDGHHRRELAKRAGAETLPVQYIDAVTADEAHDIGMEMNGGPKPVEGCDGLPDGWSICPYHAGFGLFREGRKTPVAKGATADELRGRIAGTGEALRLSNNGGGKWITIGGHEEGEKKHVGGFPVEIQADGTIKKSAVAGLQGKKVGEAKTQLDAPKADHGDIASKTKTTDGAPKNEDDIYPSSLVQDGGIPSKDSEAARSGVQKILGKYGLKPSLILNPEHPIFEFVLKRDGVIGMGLGGQHGIALDTERIKNSATASPSRNLVADRYKGQKRIEAIAMHEAAHILDRDLGNNGQSWVRLLNDVPKEDLAKISDYAGSNDPKESFAEAYSSRALGHELPASIATALDEMDKVFANNAGKGYQQGINDVWAKKGTPEYWQKAIARHFPKKQVSLSVSPDVRSEAIRALRERFPLSDLEDGR